MTWSLRVSAAAKRSLRSLAGQWPHIISKEIRSLHQDPFPANSIGLSGDSNRRRVKIGDYRVLYRVGTSTVYVFRVEKRSDDTYRGFSDKVR